MTSFKKRDVATSITTLTFLVISITGIMMFFHILDQYTTAMHKILGIAFTVFATFHVFFNWKSMRNYFKKKSFIFSTILVLLLSTGFIVKSANNDSQHPAHMVFDSVINAPLNEAVAILGKDVQSVNQILKESGLILENTNSIEEISQKNSISAFKVIKVITN